MNYWGPMVGIGSTEWIINGSMWLLQRERPQFHYIYVPHLDYAAQKFGPDSAQQAAACREADIQIGRLVDGVRAIGIRDAEFLVVSEYAMTAVSRVVYPNRVLREAGLAVVKEIDGREHLDPRASAAFAVVDHQFAHVYVRDRADIDAASGIFEGMKGIAQVLTGDERSRLGVNHPRSGEVVLVCEADAWLAYYWWHDDSKAPAFARTVDIHNKPGYDPVEMFFDPAMRSIPLNATLVRGSHGAPATMPDQIGVAVSSDPGRLAGREKARDVDVRSLIDAAFHAN
jgi:predicted AlkP superfamily pyrophosphatase or phosphodiesterase